MKLLNAQQLKAADLHTMTNEPIASIDLMERAAMACCTWLEENLPLVKNVAIFCGTGNNGGDGLAIARLLHHKGVTVHCFEIPFPLLQRITSKIKKDFQFHLQNSMKVTLRMQ